MVPTLDVWSASWSCSSHVSVLFSFSWSRAPGYGRSILTGLPSSRSRSLMRPHLTEKALQGLPTFPAHLISTFPALPGLWARVPGSPIPLPRPHLSRLPFCQAHPQKPSKELQPHPIPGGFLPGVPAQSPGSSGDTRHKVTAMVWLHVLCSKSNSTTVKGSEVTPQQCPVGAFLRLLCMTFPRAVRAPDSPRVLHSPLLPPDLPWRTLAQRVSGTLAVFPCGSRTRCPLGSSPPSFPANMSFLS